MAKKIHAPGFTSTSTTPRVVGPRPVALPDRGASPAASRRSVRSSFTARKTRNSPPTTRRPRTTSGDGSTVENPSASVASTTNSMPLAPSITRKPAPMPWRAVSLRISSCTGPGAAPRAAPSAKAGTTCSLQTLTGRRPLLGASRSSSTVDDPLVVASHEDALAFPEGRDLDAGESERRALDERGVADREPDAVLRQLIEQRQRPRRPCPRGCRRSHPGPRGPGTTAWSGSCCIAPRRNHAAVSAARPAGETKTRS